MVYKRERASRNTFDLVKAEALDTSGWRPVRPERRMPSIGELRSAFRLIQHLSQRPDLGTPPQSLIALNERFPLVPS